MNIDIVLPDELPEDTTEDLLRTLHHILFEHFKIKSSLQHLTYKKISEFKTILDVDFNEDLKIITIVRNPYDRIVSDLFFFNLI